LLSNQCQ